MQADRAGDKYESGTPQGETKVKPCFLTDREQNDCGAIRSFAWYLALRFPRLSDGKNCNQTWANSLERSDVRHSSSNESA